MTTIVTTISKGCKATGIGCRLYICLTFFVLVGRGGMGGVSSAGGSGAGRVWHTNPQSILTM